MKTTAKEMPLDQFAKEMNALNKPFHVWAIYNGVPGADFESSIAPLSCTSLCGLSLPDSILLSGCIVPPITSSCG